MGMKMHSLSLVAITAAIGCSVAAAQTDRGSAGAAGGPASSPGGTGMSPPPGATGSPAATGGPAGAGAAKKSALSRADEAFVSQAAQNGNAEIQTSKMALEKASDPKVKEFAKQMIDDHTKANEELKAIASSEGAEVPDDPSLLQKGKAMIMLSTAKDAAFDRRYAESMGVEAHEDNIQLFEKAAGSAEDPEVKAYAQKMLPKLQAHLKMAQELE